MRHPRTIATLALASIAALSFAATAVAATTITVTPSNTQGWSTADTRPGGAVTFVADATAPGGAALRLTTDATNTAKAQYLHAANVPLGSITELGYQTKQNSGPAVADPSYQLAVDLNGAATGGFTNFVFEPYWNTAQGPIVPGAWQSWDVDAGLLWSSGTFTDGTCSVVSGAGGPPFYTLAAIKAACPNAVVVGFGVNVGSFNPGYNIETDLVDFNGTTYDFQLRATATNKDDCKGGGWQNLQRADGTTFKNQGDCVSYTNNGK